MKKLIATVFFLLATLNVTYADDIQYKPWTYNNTKISEKCLNNLYPLASGDWYESYYDNYINKLDEHWGNPKYELFVNKIGDHLGKEIPIGDKYNSSWDEEMSLTRYLAECNTGEEFEYTVISELPLYFCNDFAPYVDSDCLSIVLIKHYSKYRTRLFGMTIYGLYNLNDKLTILPLRNVK